MRTYLFRVNLDIEDKEINDSPRLKMAVLAIKSLAKKNNRIIILSHRGRPDGYDKKLSLSSFRPVLESGLGKSVAFFPGFNFSEIKMLTSKADGGSIFLLENLRFLHGENNDDPQLAEQLASLGDVYIDDDFATSHRSNASNVGIAEILPSRFGPIFKKEISALNKILAHPKSPFVLIIGGHKMTDKIGVIKNLLPKVDNVLLGGGAANTFLKAKGMDIGSSYFDESMIDVARELCKNEKIILPVDFERVGDNILDIGPKTIKNYAEIIKNAETIVWNGPMGYFEDEKFAEGTELIAREVVHNKKAKIVIGGGETTAAISSLINEPKPNIHVSTGGGAMLDFLAGKELPVIKIIKAKKTSAVRK